MSDSPGRNISVEAGSLVVRVPIRMTRRRGRREIITPESDDSASELGSRTNAPLALTLARAHRWRDLLEHGHYGSIRELALELGVDDSYVARLFRLTLLAPDIVEAIINGTEPEGLSLEKLFRAPMLWEGQWAELGAMPQEPRPLQAARWVEREA
jgi:AraC-like DNA-binding protein